MVAERAQPLLALMRADVPAVTHHRLLRDGGVHVDSRLLSGPSVRDVMQLLDPSPVEEMDSLQVPVPARITRLSHTHTHTYADPHTHTHIRRPKDRIIIIIIITTIIRPLPLLQASH